MKFGLCLPNYGDINSVHTIHEAGLEAERAGFDSLWTTDHILVSEEHKDPYGNLVESLVTLAYLAGITKNVKLATSIIVLPQRDPILLAKQIASLDQLSNGRVILGIGTGWMEKEFKFLRTDFHSRGKLTDEWLKILKILWTERRPAFHGKWVTFEDTIFEPKPLQPGGPPIFIGGSSTAALRRVSMYGDGWHPVGLSVEDVVKGVQWLKTHTNRTIRTCLRMRVNLAEASNSYQSPTGARQRQISGTPRQMIDAIGAYEGAGVERIVCVFSADTSQDYFNQLRYFKNEILSKLT